MLDLVYRNYKIHIRPADYNPTEGSDLVVVITNHELNLAFSFIRKCNKIITNYTKKSYGILGNVHSDSQTFTDYNTRETVEELTAEAKVIVDMLCEMENIITEKVETKLSRIKFSDTRGFFLDK